MKKCSAVTEMHKVLHAFKVHQLPSRILATRRCLPSSTVHLKQIRVRRQAFSVSSTSMDNHSAEAMQDAKRRKIEDGYPTKPGPSAPNHAGKAQREPPQGQQSDNNKTKGQQADNNKPKGQHKSKKQKPGGIAGPFCNQIGRAAKFNDLHAAVDAWRRARHQGINLPLASYNTLLYLAVGGDQWETLVRGGNPHAMAVSNINPDARVSDPSFFDAAPTQNSKDTRPSRGYQGPTAQEPQAIANAMAIPINYRVELAIEIWSAIQQSAYQPDSGSYLALARMEGLRQQPQHALQWALVCKQSKQNVSLRTFQPALLGFVMKRNTKALEKVHALINEQGLDLMEYEFARFIEGYGSDRQGAWPQLQGVFARMSRELETLDMTTIDLINAYFTSPQAVHALPATVSRPAAGTSSTAADTADPASSETVEHQPTRWSVRPVKVDKTGFCPQAGEKLKVVDLEESEWSIFADGVATLARGNESNAANFNQFTEWLERNGPFDVMLDCANIAYFGGARGGLGYGFRWQQIIQMLDLVKQLHPNSRVLTMLHVKRTTDKESKAPEIQAFMEKLKEEKSFYVVPQGSNDDWYWLYATVKARYKGLLVSNDELRDHIFSLLRPKHFLKWKARHIAHYTFGGPQFDEPELVYPAAYTSCVQHLSNGSWMFPSNVDGNWILCSPQ